MKELELFIPIKSISVNSSYYLNRQLTFPARQTRASFLVKLQEYSAELLALRESFDPLKNALALSLTFHIPTELFFTKRGNISRRSGDLDNKLKGIIDWLCNPKFNTDWLNSKRSAEAKLYAELSSLTNLGIDDQFITELIAKKTPSIKEGVTLQIKIIDLIKA